jgi:hypothetical protein
MSISSEMFAEIIRKRDAEIERLRKVIGDLHRGAQPASLGDDLEDEIFDALTPSRQPSR